MGARARACSPATSAITAATARAMAADWLRTGDLVHRDADGVFRIVDRIKDIYISGGENVAPAEVEHALASASARRGRRRRRRARPGVGRARRRVRRARGRRAAVAPTRCSRTRARNLAAFKVPVHVEFVDVAAALDDREARPVPAAGSRAARLVEGVQHDPSR